MKIEKTVKTLDFLADNYMFKVNNRNTRARCEKCSKLTIKTPKPRQWHRFGVFHTLFQCFYCLLLASKCWLGYFISVIYSSFKLFLPVTYPSKQSCKVIYVTHKIIRVMQIIQVIFQKSTIRLNKDAMSEINSSQLICI